MKYAYCNFDNNRNVAQNSLQVGAPPRILFWKSAVCLEKLENSDIN